MRPGTELRPPPLRGWSGGLRALAGLASGLGRAAPSFPPCARRLRGRELRSRTRPGGTAQKRVAPLPLSAPPITPLCGPMGPERSGSPRYARRRRGCASASFGCACGRASPPPQRHPNSLRSQMGRLMGRLPQQAAACTGGASAPHAYGSSPRLATLAIGAVGLWRGSPARLVGRGLRPAALASPNSGTRHMHRSAHFQVRGDTTNETPSRPKSRTKTA